MRTRDEIEADVNGHTLGIEAVLLEVMLDIRALLAVSIRSSVPVNLHPPFPLAPASVPVNLRSPFSLEPTTDLGGFCLECAKLTGGRCPQHAMTVIR